jgi:hypothetical protein
MTNVKRDYHCDSSIDETKLRDKCARFLLRIHTWFHFHPRARTWGSSGRTFQCYEWAETDKQPFIDKFKLIIERDFGNGAFWICHSQRNTKDLWCDIEIVPVANRKGAQMCVNAVTGPDGRPELLWAPPGQGHAFRGWCRSLSGDRTYTPTPYDEKDQDSEAPELNVPGNTIDMHMTQAEVMKASNAPAEQSVLLHEFGHYTGLDHPCAAIGDGYCTGHSQEHRENLMAVGNRFKFEHAQGFIDRLRSHHHDYLGLEQEWWRWLARDHALEGGGDRDNRPWKGDAVFLAHVDAVMRQKEAEAKTVKEMEDNQGSWAGRSTW